MSSEESEEHPLLRLLLNERLPTLGLDIETYGPYIVALFPLSGTFGDDLVDELEGWDEILELLQASSELQDLDENVWEQLKVDLLSSWQSYQKQQAEQQKEKLLEKEVHLQKMLELERDVAKMNAEGKGADSTGTTNGSNNSSSIDDAAKRALLNRFGYEEDENDDTGKGVDGASNKGKADTAENSNATPSTMKHQHPPVTTKREEQQKTKAAQQQKVDAKEERRKRATKGERRR
jgi:hypothetical protein